MKLSRAHTVAAVLLLSIPLTVSACKRKAPQAPSDDPRAGRTRLPMPDMRPVPDMRRGPDGRPTTAPRTTPKNRPTLSVKALTADQKRAAADTTEFALKLYARLRKAQGNLFLSPWSITTALGMTYAGAQGPTAREMARAMSFHLEPSKLHPAIGALSARLAAGKGYELAIANRIYAYQGLGLRPGYVSLLKQDYGVSVKTLNFKEQPDASRRTINRWVKAQTRNRIPKLLHKPDIDKDSRMVLVNAIYFKGKWARRFDPKQTRPQPFHLTASRSVKVPLMHQTAPFGYVSTGDVSVLELPYQGGLSMVVLLPKKRDGLAALEKSLDPRKLPSLLSPLPKRKVKVWLPKFHLSSHFNLKQQLQALGMGRAFTDRADFRGMEPGRKLKISKVIHQANCDVGEQGTVAAAATAVIMAVRGMARPPAIPEFRADHPFLFLIRDPKSGVILFLGRVVDPR